MSWVNDLPKYGVTDHGEGFPCRLIEPLYRATCGQLTNSCLRSIRISIYRGLNLIRARRMIFTENFISLNFYINCKIRVNGLDTNF